MASAVTAAYLQARIDNALLIVDGLEAAILAISTGTVKSYSVNTGQTTESVTKKDVERLRVSLDSWYGMIDYWDMRLNGGGPAMYVRGA